jgi:FkbM family methyltransferase
MTVPAGYRMHRDMLWPETDRGAAAALFNDARGIPDVVAFCTGRDVAVQAGGNCGIWPRDLSAMFRLVYTFEPDPMNFRCLCANVPAENVVKFNAALGDTHETVGMMLRPDNVGAHRISGAGDIPTLRIDDLGLQSCDLIYLDIEGYEMKAIVGGMETIRRCRPVIVVEDKGLSEHYGQPKGAVIESMRSAGYRVAARLHHDVVFVNDAG